MLLAMRKRSILYGLVGLVVLSSIAASGYFYWQYRQLSSNPSAKAAKEINDTVGRVSKMMLLPTDEGPSLATVTDKGKLKDQAFFKFAENGDKVLIYAKNQKAILYRPKDNKIINVAPIALQQNQNGTVSGANATPTPNP